MKVLMVILFIFFHINAYAYFEYENFSTWSVARGNTSVVNPAGSDTVFYNPALLSGLSGLQMALNYNNRYSDVINNSIYAYNFSFSRYIYKGSVGLGYYGFSSDNYSEKQVLLGYGYDFKFISAGITLKYGNIGYEQSVKYDPVLENDRSYSFYSCDLGLLYTYNDLNTGLSVINAAASEEGVFDNNAPRRKINLGAAQRIYKIITAAGELSYDSRSFNYKLGAGILLMKDLLEINTGINKQQVSFGISTTYKNFSFDYTGIYDLLFNGLDLSQMIGLRIKL